MVSGRPTADFGADSRPKQWLYRDSPLLSKPIRTKAAANVGIQAPPETGRLMGALDYGGTPVRISGWDSADNSILVVECDYTEVEDYFGIATHGARTDETCEVMRGGEIYLAAGEDITAGMYLQMEDTDAGDASSDPKDVIPFRQAYRSRRFLPGATTAQDVISIGDPPLSSLLTASIHDTTATGAGDELVPLTPIALPGPPGATEIMLAADGKSVKIGVNTLTTDELILGYKSEHAWDGRVKFKALSPGTARTLTTFTVVRCTQDLP